MSLTDDMMADDDAAENANDPLYCPQEVVLSLLRYWHHRVPTGDFLRAVLENDLRDACARADAVNIRHLPGIVRFCWEQLPSPSWGSAENVRTWLKGKDQVPSPTNEEVV
jgi:hypothetical protein